MTVALDIMTPNVNICQESDSIRKAVELMQRENIGVVPIVDSNETLSGVITDRDICLKVVLESIDPERTGLTNVMHKDLVTCDSNEDLEEVVEKMKDAQVKRILVTENNRCIGIITEADIARSSTSELSASLAQGVYR